jgi:pheromone shutdown protein TraB
MVTALSLTRPPTPTVEQLLADLPVTELEKPDGGRVYLLGTAHTSQESAAHAVCLMRAVRPSAVVVELCKGRRHMLNSAPAPPPPPSSSGAAGSDDSSLGNLASSLSGVLADWTTAISLQYDTYERVLGDAAGGEFHAAASEAARLGARVVLGDRDVGLTLLRLKRLTPPAELLQTLLGWEDGESFRRRAYERMEEAQRLDAAATALSACAAAGERTAPAELGRLSAEVRRCAGAQQGAAASDFCDAVLAEMLWRFWCFERIGPPERARLRAALGRVHLAELDEASLTPSMRRVLLDERDVVLAHALKSCPGATVVGVVGKGHVPGIRRLWAQDTAALLPAVLEEPPLPIGRYAALGAACVALPVGAYRSRGLRLVLGTTGLGVAGGAAWLVNAVKQRIAFYERCQQEEHAVVALSKT